jgi:hypothetical protein
MALEINVSFGPLFMGVFCGGGGEGVLMNVVCCYYLLHVLNALGRYHARTSD